MGRSDEDDGTHVFPETTTFCTHQHLELLEIRMEVAPSILHRGHCPCCGKLYKASLPREYPMVHGLALLSRRNWDHHHAAGGSPADCTIISIACGFFQRLKEFLQPTTTPIECCGLPSCGASVPMEWSAERIVGGYKGFSRQGRPTVSNP
jgi:hypothetical protein